MNKKAIQLSINFIVMLILAIAMLGGSFYIVSKFFGKTIDITKKLDARTDQELENMISRGEKTAIPFNIRDVKQGDTTSFGLGILNVLGSTYNFSINITPKNIGNCNASFPRTIINPPGNMLPDQIGLVYFEGNTTIKNNANKKLKIAFVVEKATPKCQYVYDVHVNYYVNNAPQLYNRIEKIYLSVV